MLFYFPPNSIISNNFTNMAILVRTLYENTKQNVELFESYKEMVDTFFTSAKKLYLKFLDNETEKNLMMAFFMSMAPQQSPLANKKTEEQKDKEFFNMYF